MVTQTDLATLGCTPAISDSVGRGGRNKPIDVAIVQSLLDWAIPPNSSTLVSGFGIPDAFLDELIVDFQKNSLKMPKPDGRVDRSGKTIATMLKIKTTKKIPTFFGNSKDFSKFTTMNTDRMLLLVDGQFGKLADKSRAGLRYLFEAIVQDKDLIDPRWGAYMLATVKRETGVYLPIEENKTLWSKKTGANEYAEEVVLTGKDGKPVGGADGKPAKARYYGRGYVQLTWRKNYLKLGERIGLGDALARAPERALEPEIAYKIASLGMREGLFAADKAGKVMKLSRFINDEKCNYVWARQIINGLDHAEEIAKDAIAFEGLMMLATRPTSA